MKKVLYFMSVLLVILIVSACSGQKEEVSKEPESDSNNEEQKVEEVTDIKYPEKPISLVIPFDPGGDTDSNARVLSKYLEKELGKPVVPTNMSGAGGSVASQHVMDSKADGYTVLFHHNTMLLNKAMGVSPIQFSDFEGAGIAIIDESNTFTVASDSKYETIEDFIEEAKARPGELNVASAIGNFSHMLFLDFQEKTGTDFNIIDVGTGTEQRTALLADRVDLMYGTYSIIKPFVDSGEFRPLGFMSEERLPELPDIPTFKEHGVDMVYDKFFFLSFPPETPSEVVEKFTNAMETVNNNPEYQEELKNLQVSPRYMNPEESNEYLGKVQQQYNDFKEKMVD